MMAIMHGFSYVGNRKSIFRVNRFYMTYSYIVSDGLLLLNLINSSTGEHIYGLL